MKSVFIEGVCGCGKTTTVNCLGKILPAFVVPELTEFVRGLISPFNNKDNCSRNFNDYIRFEISRESILQALPNDVRFAVFDRSYVSIIALSLSMCDILPDNMSSKLVSEILSLIEQGRLAIPDALIVLSADLETIHRRNTEKDKILESIWTDRWRLDTQMRFYSELASLGSASIISSRYSRIDTAQSCARALSESQSYSRDMFIQSIDEAVRRVL